MEVLTFTLLSSILDSGLGPFRQNGLKHAIYYTTHHIMGIIC